MGDMRIEELNRLLGIALERRHRAGGLVTPQVNPHKPWLPMSYWAEQERLIQEKAADILDLAEHMKEQARLRRAQDDYLARQSVETIIEEWDDKLPTLQGDDPELRKAGWGRDRMKDMLWRGALKTPAPPDAMQPAYNNHCQFCYRPITTEDGDNWKDHGGKRSCAESGRNVHVPDGEVPWWEELEEEDEQADE